MGESPVSAYCMSCMEQLDADGTCAQCGANAQLIAAEQPLHCLPAGTVLKGRYLIGKTIGQGGFGITYIGRDLTLNLRVAIKEYYPATFANRNSEISTELMAATGKARDGIENGKRRFLGEAQVLAKFHGSPGIVDVRDYFEANGTAYIVMDYLDGETLKAHLQSATFDADTTFALMTPIIEALEQMHSENIIHRDISPDNIMLCSDGSLCLMDFGAAREMDFGDRQSVSMVLKSGYAPEEQYRAKGELGPWTDIYALCATMYRAITGVAPDESLQRLIGDEMKWPSEMGIAITEEQELVLKRGMEPLHTKRYQSISEMKADLPQCDNSIQTESSEGDAVVAAVGEELAPEPAQPAEQPAEAPVPAPSEPEEDSVSDKESRRRIKPVFAGIAAVLVAAIIGCIYLFAPLHTVYFDLGTGADAVAVKANRVQPIDELAAPTRDSYVFEGWYYDEAHENEVDFPLLTDSDTTIHAAWKKVQAGYTVRYVDKITGGEIADRKVVEHADVDSEVVEDPQSISGYTPDSKDAVSLKISADESANEIVFYYTKLVSYEVRYLTRGSESSVAETRVVDGQLQGATVIEAAPSVPGYTLVSDASQSIVLSADKAANQITFYYEPERSATVYTGYTAAANSSSNTNSNSSGGTSSASGGGTVATPVSPTNGSSGTNTGGTSTPAPPSSSTSGTSTGGATTPASPSSNDVEWAN